MLSLCSPNALSMLSLCPPYALSLCRSAPSAPLSLLNSLYALLSRALSARLYCSALYAAALPMLRSLCSPYALSLSLCCSPYAPLSPLRSLPMLSLCSPLCSPYALPMLSICSPYALPHLALCVCGELFEVAGKRWQRRRVASGRMRKGEMAGRAAESGELGWNFFCIEGSRKLMRGPLAHPLAHPPAYGPAYGPPPGMHALCGHTYRRAYALYARDRGWIAAGTGGCARHRRCGSVDNGRPATTCLNW